MSHSTAAVTEPAGPGAAPHSVRVIKGQLRDGELLASRRSEAEVAAGFSAAHGKGPSEE